MDNSPTPTSIDAYIEALPDKQRLALTHLRQIIKTAAPKAAEIISYKMPAFKYYGQLCYFAAYANHYSLYAVHKEGFMDELKDYKVSKGTIQFPYDKPLPDDLVSRLIAFRVAENEAKQEVAKAMKTTKTKNTTVKTVY